METHFPNLKSNMKAANIISEAPRRQRNNQRVLIGFALCIIAYASYLSLTV